MPSDGRRDLPAEALKTSAWAYFFLAFRGRFWVKKQSNPAIIGGIKIVIDAATQL